jgi:hypothetical protein
MTVERSEPNGSPALGRGRRRGFAKHGFAPPQPAGDAGPAVERGWGAFNSPLAAAAALNADDAGVSLH